MTPEQLRRYFMPNVLDEGQAPSVAPVSDIPIAPPAQVESTPMLDRQTVAEHFLGSQVAPQPTDPITSRNVPPPYATPDALSGADRAAGSIPRSVADDPALQESIYGAFGLPAPGVLPDDKVELEGPSDEQTITESSTEPTVGAQVDDGVAPGQEENVPQTSRQGISAPPVDPLLRANWAAEQTNVLGDRSRAVLDSQTDKNVREARLVAEESVRAMEEMTSAFEDGARRQKELKMLRDSARDELERRSNRLAQIAEQGIRQRPGYDDRSAGRALLAIASGMGVASAGNIFQASLADEERNDRMDVERFNSNINALRSSVDSQGNVFESLGDQALDDQRIDDARSIAQEKLALQRLGAKVAELGPGRAKDDGEKLLLELEQKLIDRQLQLADSQVQSLLTFRKLNAPTVVKGKAAGKRPEPPKPPVKQPGQDEVSHNIQIEQYQDQLEHYNTVELPTWQAKSDAERRNGGKPPVTVTQGAPYSNAASFFLQGRGPVVTSVKHSTSIQVPRTIKKRSSAEGSKAPPASASSTRSQSAFGRLWEQASSQDRPGFQGNAQAPVAQATPPATSSKQLGVADQMKASKKAQNAIYVPRTKIVLNAKDGREITADESTKNKLRSQFSDVETFVKDLGEYARLAAAAEGDESTVAGQIAAYATKSNINFKIAQEQMINSKHANLSQRLNVINQMGAMTGNDEKINSNQLQPAQLVVLDSKGKVETILDLAKTVMNYTADRLESVGYDVDEYRKYNEAQHAVTRGMFSDILKPDEASGEVGTAKADREKAKTSSTLKSATETSKLLDSAVKPDADTSGIGGVANWAHPDDKKVYEQVATRSGRISTIKDELKKAQDLNDFSTAKKKADELNKELDQQVSQIEKLVSSSYDRFGNIKLNDGTVDLSIIYNDPHISRFMEPKNIIKGRLITTVWRIKGKSDQERRNNSIKVFNQIASSNGASLRPQMTDEVFKSLRRMSKKDFNTLVLNNLKNNPYIDELIQLMKQPETPENLKKKEEIFRKMKDLGKQNERKVFGD